MRVLRAVRLGVFLVTMMWGVGVIAVSRDVPPEALAWLTAVVVALVATAAIALLSDPPSFYIATATLLGPMLFAVATDAHMRNRVGAAIAIGLYGMGIVIYYRRAHAGLLRELRGAKRMQMIERAAAGSRARAERLAAIVEATSDYVGIARADMQLEYMNHAGRARLGIGLHEDISGMAFLDLVPPKLHEAVARDTIPATLRDGTWSGEVTLRSRDDREIPFKAHELFGVVERWQAAAPASAAAAVTASTDAAAAVVPENAPVNLDAFREMLESAGISSAGDPILRLFLSDTRARVTQLQNASDARDAAGIHVAAHGLKSAAGNIRAEALTAMLARAEHASTDGILDGMSDMVSEISAEYTRVSDYVNTALAVPAHG